MRKRSLKSQINTEYNLGERIKFIRESRRMTQAETARLTGLNQGTLANLENGKKDPSVETLQKIATALDVHVATLFATTDVYVFDLKRLRRKYKKADQLTGALYKSLGLVIQYAKGIGYI